MLGHHRLVLPVVFAGLLLCTGCPGSATGTSGGGADGGVTDAGGGVRDGGATDGGTTDGGLTDGGTTDGGPTDPCAGVSCGSLTDACNTGVCDPTTGTCIKQPVADGTACDDGDACTTSDQCAGGTCAGTPLDCSGQSDACHTGVCDPTTGSCIKQVMADGTACNDGNACTTSDQCQGGTCAGTPVDCSGQTDQCNTGTCDATSGSCVATPVTDGTACSTGNLCSWSDACASGTCTSGFVGDCGPTTFVVPDTDATSVLGGTGGSAYTDDCPLGQVPIGIRGQVSIGYYYRVLDHVAVICGTPAISGSTVTMGPGATVPATGGQGLDSSNVGPPETHLCPTNEVVVGYAGATNDTGGTFVSEITLQCAPLILGGSPTTGFGIAIGAITPASTLGTVAASPVPATVCPLGMVARGITGASGDVLDTFGLTCGKPALQLVTTAPGGGGQGGSGTAQDCPPDQVPIGLIASVADAPDFTGELTQVSLQCGVVSVKADGKGGWTSSIAAGVTVPASGAWGSYGGVGPAGAACPADQAVVGLAGSQGSGTGTYTGTFVQQATLRCAPLAFTGDVTSGFTVGYDPATIGTKTIGTLKGTAFGPSDCPAGTVARGLTVRSGAILDGIALRCAPVVPTVK